MTTFLPNEKRQIVTAVNNLLKAENPDLWKDWLTDIQAQLISAGHCESLTRKGSEHFASMFLELQNFFSNLRDLQKQS